MRLLIRVSCFSCIVFICLIYSFLFWPNEKSVTLIHEHKELTHIHHHLHADEHHNHLHQSNYTNEYHEHEHLHTNLTHEHEYHIDIHHFQEGNY